MLRVVRSRAASRRPINPSEFSDISSNCRFLGAKCHRSQLWHVLVKSTDAFLTLAAEMHVNPDV
jgi:hypothetical protein